MYCDRNFKTKKALKEAIANNEWVGIYCPGGMFPAPTNGVAAVEGPWYPKPHSWYARVVLKDGRIIGVK